MCICYIFLTHSSVDGYLGCFYTLAIVNNTAMNILHVYVSFKLVFSFSSIWRNGIARSYSSSGFSFWGTSILLSTVAAPIYISTNSIQGFPFLYILTNICYLWSFWWQPFWQVWGAILVLICISLSLSLPLFILLFYPVMRRVSCPFWRFQVFCQCSVDVLCEFYTGRFFFF